MLLQDMAAETPMEFYNLTEADLERVRQIQKERYDTWEWNYGNSPAYAIVKERRFDGCGKLEVHMNVEKVSLLLSMYLAIILETAIKTSCVSICWR